MNKLTAYKWEDWATSYEHSRLMDSVGFVIACYVIYAVFKVEPAYWLYAGFMTAFLSFCTSTVPYARLFFWPMFAILVPYYSYTDPQSIIYFITFDWKELHLWVPNGLVGTLWFILAVLSASITAAYGSNWKPIAGITLLSQLFKK